MVRTRTRSRCWWLLPVVLFGLILAKPAGAAPMTPAGWRLTPRGVETTVLMGPGLAGPRGAAVSPDGRSVLVTSSGTAARFESVERSDVASMTRTGLVAMWPSLQRRPNLRPYDAIMPSVIRSATQARR
jgi:hypothetical protein